MRLIDADALFPNEMFFVNADDPMASLSELLGRLCNAPSVDAEPVRHGERSHRTIWHVSGWGEIYTSYSCCGLQEKGKTHHNYCPNCGAKMDGGKQDEHAKED